MKLEEFKAICSCYDGDFTDTKWGQIQFSNKNEITSFYQDGSIHTRKKVDCEIELSHKGTLSACESTHSILGGCGGYEGTAERLKELLTRYNFNLKAQLSIFDLAERQEE